MVTTPPVKKSQYVSMGTYRLVLAFFVFCSHSLYQPLQLGLNIGITGVVLFFVVSGWIITGALLTVYYDRVGGFLANRALRLYPAMWATFIFCALVLYATGRDTIGLVTLKNWTSVSDVLIAGSGIFSYPIERWGVLASGWSLTAEMWFYLVIAAVALAGGDRPARLVKAGWIALALFGVVMMSMRQRWYNPIFFTPYFVLGVALYLRRLPYKPAGVDPLIWVSLVLGFCDLILTFQGDDGYSYNFLLVLHPQVFWPQFDRSWPGGALFVLMTGSFLILTHLNLRGRLKAFDQFAGDITYSVYLIHFPLGQFLQKYGKVPETIQDFWLFFTICVFAAYLLHILVEKPFAEWRAQIRAGAAGA